MNFKAVIFDMDGLLIDSEFYWIQAEMNFLGKYNIPRTRELAAKMTGRSIHESVALLKEEYGLEPTVDELLGEKKYHSDAIYEYQAQKMAGVDELLEELKNREYITAIASGSSLDRIMKIVQRFSWEKYFNALVSTDHVNLKGKPDPAIYSYASQVLGVLPEYCVVLEDSVNGVRAAKGAGMSCVAVPDSRWSYGDFGEADLQVASLSDNKLYSYLGL